jgi:hypothetical protein
VRQIPSSYFTLLLLPLLLLLQVEAVAASGFGRLLHTTWHAGLQRIGIKSSKQALQQQVRAARTLQLHSMVQAPLLPVGCSCKDCGSCETFDLAGIKPCQAKRCSHN